QTQSKLEPDPTPGSDRRAGSEERRRADGVISIHGSKRPRDETAGIVIWRGAELRRRVITMIEQVIDLNEETHVLLRLILSPRVQHSIAGRKSGAEVVDGVRPVLVILITARIRSSHCVETH